MTYFETSIPLSPVKFFIELYVQDFNQDVGIAVFKNYSILIATDHPALFRALEINRDFKSRQITNAEKLKLFLHNNNLDSYLGNENFFK